MSSLKDAIDHLLSTFSIRPNGILQVGAHEGQERGLFLDYGIKRVVFVEPNPSVYKRLQSNVEAIPGYTAVNAVCTEFDGQKVVFNVASNEESSSILPLGRHGELFPHIKYDNSFVLFGRSVDGLCKELHLDETTDMLILDTQGSELSVLKGSTTHLAQFKAIFTEASETPLYDDGCTLVDLISFLTPLGYGLKWCKMSQWKTGDALFVKN